MERYEQQSVVTLTIVYGKLHFGNGWEAARVLSARRETGNMTAAVSCA
jgi:hypothetical protein